MSKGDSREKAVFCQAVDIADPEQRREFLDQACGVDKALRERVERLLALSQTAGNFFKECAPALEAAPGDAAQLLSGADTELPEITRVGPYKLLQKLGEGGYGVVYMAEQDQPIRRRVALKIIKLGMDTKNVIARFEAERQALALMDHPNIARVLDAGATESGRPYFVMELVYGVKITDYCDQNRVSMQERLELFTQVCNAVQHAHQKGIIHRDLKPSNIMVTMHDGVPVPKVIDFGIAKATEQRLTDKTLFTSYAQLMGTPAYMSPEQMEFSGLNLDTRSDIYALGVLLYELLTGRTPFDTTDLLKLGVDELRRTVREQEPLSPSAKLQTLKDDELTKAAKLRRIEAPRLFSQIRGDLDWIVLKCLEKDRTRRYPTANALALDIERFLHEETVMARPPSRMYRLQKLVRRNRKVFLSGAVAVVTLLACTVISTSMLIKEREARSAEARLRHEAELREQASRVALLVTQRRFEEADKLMAGIPLDKPSIEVAAELRSLGDWHAAKHRWHEGAERFQSLVKVNQFDDPETASIDQLRLAASLLEEGRIDDYEQWRQRAAGNFTTIAAPLPASVIKACLLMPASSELIERLSAASQSIKGGVNTAFEPRAALRQGIAWPDTKVLFEYRCGDRLDSRQDEFLASNPPQLATFWLVEAMATWRSKDYWGAMVNWTKAYSLVQAGARRGLVPMTMQSEIFPGLSESGYLQSPWYDWAVADILLREWNQMIAEAEQPIISAHGEAPNLETLAIIRAAGECHALRGEWTEALRCAQYCLASNQQDTLDHATMDYLNAAIESLELNDEKTYLRVRDEMATRFKAAGDVAPWRALEIGLAKPIDPSVAPNLKTFADGLVSWSRVETNDYWGLMLVSLYSYRVGDYAGAMDLARQSRARIRDGARLPEAELGIISALCLSRMGNRSAAQAELDRANSVILTSYNIDYDVWHWRHWVLVRLLLQEARSSISQPGFTQAKKSEP